MNVNILLVFTFIFIFGLCVGSFINVIISRLPEKGALLAKKRSCCPFCGNPIKAFDLIPIISFLVLKGKCRSCNADISPLYPAVELLCALFAIFSLWFFGPELKALIAFGVTAVLLAITVIDFNTSEIPDSLVISIGIFAVASIWIFPEVGIIDRLIGLTAVSIPMLIIALIVNGAFGGGDIKLMAAGGFLLGWQSVILAFFLALLTGGSYAIFLMITKRRDKKGFMVFGPALCLGIAISFFFGNEIISWYLRTFMLL